MRAVRALGEVLRHCGACRTNDRRDLLIHRLELLLNSIPPGLMVTAVTIQYLKVVGQVGMTAEIAEERTALVESRIRDSGEPLRLAD